MCDTLKAEFKLNKFGFSCLKPESLYTCQWPWHPAIYLTVRIVMAAYSLGALIGVCVMSIGTDDKNIMVYLTIWTFTLLTLYLWIATAIALLYQPKNKNNVSGPSDGGIDNVQYVPSGSCDMQQVKTQKTKELDIQLEPKLSIPWFLKLSWLLANVVQVFEIIVTIIYFSLLFPNMENRGYMVNDMNMHAVNSIFVLLDFCICARPIYFLHFIQPAIYGLIYIFFSVIYWTQDHEKNVIYSVLDWNSPGFAIGLVFILAFIIIPIFQLAYFGMYHLRLWIFKKIYKISYFEK